MSTSGPPICTSRPSVSRPLGGLGEVLEDVLRGDRLGAVAQPGRRDHRRQALHEVAHDAVRLAAGADHHRGAEVGQRRALAAAAPPPSRRGCAGARTRAARRARRGRPRAPTPSSAAMRAKPSRRLALALHEALAVAAAAHRVDEVVGDVDVRCRRRAASRRRARRPRAARSPVAPAPGRGRGCGRAPGSARRARARRARPASWPPTNPVAPVTSARMLCLRTTQRAGTIRGCTPASATPADTRS